MTIQYYDNGPFLDALSAQADAVHQARRQRNVLFGIVLFTLVGTAAALYLLQQQHDRPATEERQEPV